MLLVLFLLVSQYSVVSTISGCHSGRNKDHRTLVSCVSQGLTAVPDGIDPGIEILVLSHNAFVSLSWATYTTFTRLHELDLSQNNINTIHPTGPKLENLHVLRLSNNSLTGLEGATFKSTPSLREIHLDGNNISSLDDVTFSDLQFLELINLSRNKLHILPPLLLKHISSSNLKNFDLEENCVQHLPEDFFASKPDLPYVFLSSNSWVCTCQVTYLKNFLDDQSYNVYRHTGPSSIENDPESVVCSAPSMLRGQAIMNLDVEEYCSSSKNGFQDSTVGTSPSLTDLDAEDASYQPEIYRITSTQMAVPTNSTTIIAPTSIKHTTLISSIPTTIQPPTPTPMPKNAEYNFTSILFALTTIYTTIITPTTIKQTTLISSTPTTVQPTTATPMPKNAEYTLTSIVIAPTTNNPTTITPATTKQTTFISKISTATPSTTPTTIHPTRPTPTATTAEYRPTSILTALTTNNPTTITPATTKQTTFISKISTATPSTTPTTIHPTRPTPTATTAEYRPTPILTALTTNNPTTSRSITMVTGLAGGILSAYSGGQHSVPWCWWLFITVLLLCIFSAISSCMLFLWLIITYITLYQPIKRRVHKSQDVILRAYQVTVEPSLTVDRPEEESVLFLPPEMIRETQSVFRSVLFISKCDEDCEADGRREGTKNYDKEKKRMTDTVTKIDLLPEVTLHREQETESKGREEVFRKTLYRVIRREEEIEGWKEVENFCRLMERDKERAEGGVERGKIWYSLILREETESEMESRKKETEWLVGEWELRGGGLGN